MSEIDLNCRCGRELEEVGQIVCPMPATEEDGLCDTCRRSNEAGMKLGNFGWTPSGPARWHAHYVLTTLDGDAIQVPSTSLSD